MRAFIFFGILLLIAGCLQPAADNVQDEPLDVPLDEPQDQPVEPPKVEPTCEEFCPTQSQAQCAGQWNISGTYPDCNCTYVCDEEPLGDEELEEVEVSIVSAPGSVEAGTEFMVIWMVSGPEMSIPHTAVHYGSESDASEYGTNVTPADSIYTALTQKYASGEFDIPGEFSATMTAPDEEGTLYYRAHAIADGKNYWTSEMSVDVFVPEPELQQYTVDADDNGFYMDGQKISTLHVDPGDVEITFEVRRSGVYYGGLDFRSTHFDTDSVTPGNSVTVEFTAESDFKVTSYWPATGRKKADLFVDVN